MNREERIVKLKLDVIFKRVFGEAKNKAVIAALISDLLDIPRASIKEILIDNVELTPETIRQKFSRLDLRLNVDGRIINIEMQVNHEPAFKERTLFYWSKLYAGELGAGDEYGVLKQTIWINIINFNLFDCEDYHSHFRIKEDSRGEMLTDKFSIHFFELKKLGKVKRNQRMEDWLRLINAETEGDLMAIQQTTEVQEIQDVIVMLRDLSADEQVRREAEIREKALRDEASAMSGARQEGREEGRAEGRAEGREEGRAEGKAEGREEERNKIAETMRKNGFTEEQIALALGSDS